jgi:hypothetical protein
MAAEATVNIAAQMLGLGLEQSFVERFTLTNTPTKYARGYPQQAVADTEEALDLGNVATVDLIVIKAVTNDMTIDPSFSSTYRAGITVLAGELAVFCPVGTVKIKNADAAEQVTFEYMVIGR